MPRQHWHTASSIHEGINPQHNIKIGYSDIPANATRFLWDGMRLAAEIEPGLSRSYVYHPDQPYTPLARCDSVCSDGVAQAGGRVLWFHTNPLGTPEALADQDGTLVWQSHYRAWGELNATEGGEHQPLRFPGQYHDSESGLHYNTFRYYDPETGRYLSPDPIGLAGGLNLYSYVPDPNGWMDPWGWTTCALSAADKKCMGPAPAGMKNPHRHHIVREMAPQTWSKTNQDLIFRPQKILRKHGLNENTSFENFTWAQNGGGAHTIKAAKHVDDVIFKADQLGGKQEVLKALQKLGLEMRKGNFY